jgi:hypothetical protein
MKTSKTTNSCYAAIMSMAFIGGLLLFSFNTAMAQKKWSVELRPGVNFPTNDLGDVSLKTGLGIEGSLTYQFIPQLGVYAGWSWNQFSSNLSDENSKLQYEETGYCLGLQFRYPGQASKINYLVKGGGTYNHIETENKAGVITNNTGHGLGWQIGTGVTLPLTKNLCLIPELRYRSLVRDMKTGSITKPVELNYFSAGVGLSLSF